MISVDDHSRFKVTKCLKSKDHTTAALQSYIADYIFPAERTMGPVHIEKSGEFEGTFQHKPNGLSITYQLTPPDTSQYNGVADRALGLLREKTTALKKQGTGASIERFWAEA